MIVEHVNQAIHTLTTLPGSKSPRKGSRNLYDGFRRPPMSISNDYEGRKNRRNSKSIICISRSVARRQSDEIWTSVVVLTSACEVGSSRRLLESRTRPRLVGRYLSMTTEALTMVYANNVPIDMNSTSFSKSKNRAINAHMNADIAKLIIGTCNVYIRDNQIRTRRMLYTPVEILFVDQLFFFENHTYV